MDEQNDNRLPGTSDADNIEELRYRIEALEKKVEELTKAAEAGERAAYRLSLYENGMTPDY